ncbi:MAG: xylulokinase, partial [Anaerolineales bacterium]|nr:xylulokinase [Anaerolineales bacterium]
MKTRHVFMGIDVGTSAVKVVLVRLDGKIASEASVEQAVVEPYPTWSEQDPELLWQSTRTAIKKVISNCAQLPYSTEVISISVTGQMHTGVFLDQASNIIRPAILWNDSRTSSQCEEIIDALGMDRLYHEIGNLALEGFTAPKILWLKQNEPDNYSQLRTILMPKDYIRYRLTGELATDESDAAGTILYDVRKQEWSQPVLESLDIASEILPPVLKSTAVCGTMSEFIARDLRLPEQIPVICGGADNAVGAVSSGVVVPGQSQSSIGTSGTIFTPVIAPLVGTDMKLHMFSHCVPDMWYLMGTILSAGNSLKWLRNTFAPAESYETLVGRASNVNVGAEGLIFLPYLSGERTPHNNPNARGVFFGLNTSHSLAHLTRAVLEGVGFALKDSIELIKVFGIS